MTGDTTELLARASKGEAQATHQLMPIIYEQLRRIAHRQLGFASGARALETTALVHEAYLALFGGAPPSWESRSHFYRYAAKTMRSILTEDARTRLAQKRGGDAERVDIAAVEVGQSDDSADIVALDQALTRIAADHPRVAQVVELRFFAGLSVEDTAAALEVDPRSVERDWQKARAFINLALER